MNFTVIGILIYALIFCLLSISYLILLFSIRRTIRRLLITWQNHLLFRKSLQIVILSVHLIIFIMPIPIIILCFICLELTAVSNHVKLWLNLISICIQVTWSPCRWLFIAVLVHYIFLLLINCLTWKVFLPSLYQYFAAVLVPVRVCILEGVYPLTLSQISFESWTLSQYCLCSTRVCVVIVIICHVLNWVWRKHYIVLYIAFIKVWLLFVAKMYFVILLFFSIERSSSEKTWIQFFWFKCRYMSLSSESIIIILYVFNIWDSIECL